MVSDKRKKEFLLKWTLSRIMSWDNRQEINSKTTLFNIAEVFGDYLPLIQQKLNALNLEKDIYSEWHQGKVYKISVEVAGQRKEFIILKHRIEEASTALDATLKEFKFHKKSYDLLQKHPDIAQDIWIPKLYGCLEWPDNYLFIVMDFIPGPTIYTAKIQAILPILYDQINKQLSQEKTEKMLGDRESFIAVQNDKEAKYAMDKIFSLPEIKEYKSKIEQFHAAGGDIAFDNNFDFRAHIGLKNILQIKIQNNLPYLEEIYAGVFDKLKKMYSLSIKNHERITRMEAATQKFIQLTNDEEIYHNDYRSRNIILWEDNKTYVLDFWSAASTLVHKKERKDIGDMLLTNRIKSLE